MQSSWLLRFPLRCFVVIFRSEKVSCLTLFVQITAITGEHPHPSIVNYFGNAKYDGMVSFVKEKTRPLPDSSTLTARSPFFRLQWKQRVQTQLTHVGTHKIKQLERSIERHCSQAFLAGWLRR